jgi:hypothetical protein
MEQQQSGLKRKMLQFVESNATDTSADALLLVASEFAKSPCASTNRWLSIDLIVSKKNLGSFVTRSFCFMDSRPMIRLRGPEGVM